MDTYHKLKPALGWPFGFDPLPGELFRWQGRENIGPWDLAGREFPCAVALVYGDDLNAAINSLEQPQAQASTLWEALAGLAPGDLVASFNYDVLTERVLTLCYGEFPRVTPRGNWDNRASVGPWLCKPHGSLSWRSTPSPGGGQPDALVWPNDTPIPERGISENLRPALIAPVPFKSELLDAERQQEHSPSLWSYVTAQWRWLDGALREADEIRFVGYGMPGEDSHFAHGFGTAVGHGGRNPLIRVWDTVGGYERVEAAVGRAIPARNFWRQRLGEITPVERAGA
jgi:hypothetical protein